jgi:hypothetical protein
VKAGKGGAQPAGRKKGQPAAGGVSEEGGDEDEEAEEGGEESDTGEGSHDSEGDKPAVDELFGKVRLEAGRHHQLRVYGWWEWVIDRHDVVNEWLACFAG